MPLPSPISKASMSVEELAACECFLDGHREYAIELLSDIEVIRQWHKADSCPETRARQACSLCELCGKDGLLGVTKKVLETCDDADNRLRQVRASLGKNAPARGTVASSREILFTNQLAKTIFLGIVTAGENLRSQHATWAVRLQSVVAKLPIPSLHHVSARSGYLDKNRKGNTLPPTFVDRTIIGSEADPKLSTVATSLVPQLTSNSSMFFVFRRCLDSDCRCDAHKANAESKENLRDACGSQATSKVRPPPSGSKKTRKSKATRSSTTNPPGRSKKTSDTLDKLAQAKADAQTGPDTRAFDTPSVRDMMPGEPEPSGPAPDAALSRQETETFSPSPECETLIVDPRVFRLRAEVVRSNAACRALMHWCRAWVAELQSDPQERHRTGPTNGSITRGTHGHSSALSLGFERVEPRRSRRTTGEVTPEELSHGDDETTGQEMQFTSEQEELKEQWLMAQQKRCKRPKKTFGSRLKVPQAEV